MATLIMEDVDTLYDGDQQGGQGAHGARGRDGLEAHGGHGEFRDHNDETMCFDGVICGDHELLFLDSYLTEVFSGHTL